MTGGSQYHAHVIRRPPLHAIAGMLLVAMTQAGPARPAPQGGSEPVPARQRFLEMFARGYFPGRTGQLLVVPPEGVIITRQDPNTSFMHGSPWPYDISVPMLFVGAQVTPGAYTSAARQQDVAPTVAAALGVSMPPTSTGRVLPILVPGAPRPRAVVLLVLDGMRVDYFERYAAELPNLTRLRRQGAWMRGRIDYLPTNTAVGHSTIATGADPRIHGITGNNLYERVRRTRHDTFAGWEPHDLMALTIADVWQLENRGRPVVVALGASVPASTALAGHGACQRNGAATTLAGYDERSGTWQTNRQCFAPIDLLTDMDARRLWPADGRWMGHRIDTPSGVRRSGLFPRFEADALVRLIEASDIGRDDIADLVLANYKAADYVGHKHGPASEEIRVTLREMDTHLARILAAVERKVGGDYLLAITGDHGMPGEPPTEGRYFAPHVVARLHARFDPGQRELIPYYEPENAQIFVDADRLAALGLTLDELARFLESEPYIFAAFTEDDVRRAAGTLR
jgi:hypothetical protein